MNKALALEFNIMEVNFEKGNGLVPAIIQDATSEQVLMLGYMNKEALDKTLNESRVTFYSRTKERLWTKGETSGNYLSVEDITTDCDQDTILIRAKPAGPVCHKGTPSCFGDKDHFNLKVLEKIIMDRKEHPTPGSYTNKLFEEGLDRISQKVGEEAVEVVIASKNDNNSALLEETADLLYHLQVLLVLKGQSLDAVYQVLSERHQD